MSEENGAEGARPGEEGRFRRMIRQTVARIATNHTLGGFVRATNQLPPHSEDVGVRPLSEASIRELADRQRRKRDRRLFAFYAALGILSVASVVIALNFFYRLATER